MAFFINNIPFTPSEFPFKFGMVVSNDATTPNTKVVIGTGEMRDASNGLDISVTAPITIDATKNGANGLDQGSLAANTIYQVFIIADSSGNNATAGLLAIDTPSSPPISPKSYDAIRSIGYCVTDGSAHFLKMFCSGAGLSGSRYFMYDAPQATPITAGNATSYTEVDLEGLVPTLNSNESCRPVIIKSVFTPNAANDKLFLQPGDGTGDFIVVNGQVATVPVITYSILETSYNTEMFINYKVSTGSAAVALSVAGFVF